MSGSLRFSTGIREAFGSAGARADFRIPGIPQRAFGSDELKIGSIVYGRLKPLLGAGYAKEDNFRPLVVTGLLRRGDDLEKIEVMNCSTAMHKKNYPCLFPFALSKLSGKTKDTFLYTSSLYLLDNEASLFSIRRNRRFERLKDEMWTGILACRASAVIFNPDCRYIGQSDFSLEREGFVFDTVPFYSVRGKAFVPEIQTQAHLSRPADILPQAEVNEIVSFAVSYTQHMRQENGHAYFTFPDVADWPGDIPRMNFPRWAPRPTKEGGLRPHLP